MDDVTILRIRTPPPDEVMEHRISRRQEVKHQVNDIILAGLIAILLTLITIWARTNTKRS